MSGCGGGGSGDDDDDDDDDGSSGRWQKDFTDLVVATNNLDIRYSNHISYRISESHCRREADADVARFAAPRGLQRWQR